MTNTPESNKPDSSSPSGENEAPGMNDPRYPFAMLTSAIGEMIESTPEAALSNPTPCPDFTVKELFEHLILVMRRVAVIGNGGHWSSIEQEAQDGGWRQSFAEAAHDVQLAWTDGAKLNEMYEVPWGEMPGAPMMLVYSSELATHAWDLAQATGHDFAMDDDVLAGVWAAVQHLPAEGREDPGVPFGPVVHPADDAPLLLKIAGWMGRDVA